MSGSIALNIDKLFIHSSEISFQRTSNNEPHPSIMFGFTDETIGRNAYHALKAWAKNDELIIALNRRNECIEATLIHSTTHETIVIRELVFSEKNFLEFTANKPEDRRVFINYYVQTIGNNVANSRGIDLSPLALLRYIVIAG